MDPEDDIGYTGDERYVAGNRFIAQPGDLVITKRDAEVEGRVESTPEVAEIGSHEQLLPERKLGSEPLNDAGEPLGVDLSDFWGWSSSDLIDNLARGVLAEFIVATAVGIPTTCVRIAWAPWDLTLADPPIRIEVKSAAYLQTWAQKQFSAITFATPTTRAFDAATGEMEAVPRHQADVYVFALLAHKDIATLDPLNVRQWRFFVVATAVLEARSRGQRSITLTALKCLADELSYQEVGAAVRAMAPSQT